MSEMVERVAKAIGGVLDDLSDERNWPGFRREIGRAAIEAMREPTAGMCDAGYDVATASYFSEIARIWVVMIDAALREKP